MASDGSESIAKEELYLTIKKTKIKTVEEIKKFNIDNEDINIDKDLLTLV